MKGKEIEKKLKNEVGPMAKKSYQVQSQICLFKNENDEIAVEYKKDNE